MPLARIDLLEGKSPEFRRTLADVVYQAMVAALKTPENDRFQVINEHKPENFFFDPHFFNIERQNCIFIQMTLKEGRTLAQKSDFYKQVVDGLHDKLGHRREDVFISLVPVGAEDWSFGNGEASLVK